MGNLQVEFHQHPQNLAITTFLPLLHPHLPQSNPIYNRLIAPHNVPSRHCLFAATFPPNAKEVPSDYTIIFADRSRHAESQIWLFNPFMSLPNPLTEPLNPSQTEILTAHLEATIRFLRDTEIPSAPGWPFSPTLKFACLHERLADVLLRIGEARDAVERRTRWKLWMIDLTTLPKLDIHEELPEGYLTSRVPEGQLDTVISTSSIPRQRATLLLQPSVGLINAEGKLVAWGYIGIDGTLATLFVQPEERGKGLASFVAKELLGRLGRGEFIDLGFQGKSGWAHSDVYSGNAPSEGVMKSLGGKVLCESYYIWIDSTKY